MRASKSPLMTAAEVEIFTVPREAVVRHTVLWEIIGAYLAAAVTGSHLTAPGGGDLGVLPGLLRLVKLGSQDLHGPILVLILAPLVLTFHHRTGGQDV